MVCLLCSRCWVHLQDMGLVGVVFAISKAKVALRYSGGVAASSLLIKYHPVRQENA